MNAPQSTEQQTLVWQLSHAYTFALPERESNELTALLMRAARVIKSAEDIIESGKDGIFTELTDDAEVQLRKDMRDWLEAIR
jgi:hypothetical protein